MDGDITYRFGEIEGLAQQVGTRIKNFEARLQQMSAKIKEVTGFFDGASYEAMMATHAKFNTAMEDMFRVLASIQMAINTTNDDARAVENQNAARFGG